MSTLSVQLAFRLDLLLNNLHQIWPLPSFFLTHLTEVDHVTMVCVRRAVIDLLPTNIGKDPFGISRVFRNQPCISARWD